MAAWIFLFAVLGPAVVFAAYHAFDFLAEWHVDAKRGRERRRLAKHRREYEESMAREAEFPEREHDVVQESWLRGPPGMN